MERANIKLTKKGEEWAELIRMGTASGLPLKAWCREHEVSYEKFLNWKRRFKQAGVLEQIDPRVTATLPGAGERCRYLSVFQGGRCIRIVLGVIGRPSIDYLAAVVFYSLGLDPLEGDLFVFAGKGRRDLYLLQRQETGYCLGHKRLERGRITWPTKVDENGRADLTRSQFTAILRQIQ